MNEAPTAVTLDNAVTTIAEITDTTGGVKVADINISDDAIDNNTVTHVGDDAALFTTVDNGGQLELHFVGASPNFENAAENDADGPYGVTVVVDDTTVDLTPDVTVDFSLAVTDVNEAPEVDLANSKVVLTTDKDVAITGTVTAIDVDGGTLVYSIEAGDAPNSGMLMINSSNGDYTYTPTLNTNGSDSFTVSIFDGVDTITQVVNLTVDAVDDAPVANDTLAATDENTAALVDVDTLILEVDGDAFMVTASVDPAHGTVSIAGTVITFMPASNYNGAAPITYTVTDTTTGALADSGTISMTINAVDDAPQAADDIDATDEDVSTVIDVASLITELDGDAVEVTASVNSLQGSVTVSGTEITFTPLANFNGTADITYTVTDDTVDGLSDTGIVSVTVNALNDASELDAAAQVDPTFTEAVNGAAPVPAAVADAETLTDVDGLDYDSGVFSAAVTDGDASDALFLDTSGSVTRSGNDVSVNVTVVGGVSGLGTASLTYISTSESSVASGDITLDLSDGDGLSSTQQMVSVEITAVNDAPVANDVAFSASEGAFASTVNVTTFGTADSDPEGDTFSVTSLADVDDDPLDMIAVGGSGTVNGSAGVITTHWGAEFTLQSEGQLFYNLTSVSARFNELALGESPVDSFTYTITDVHGATDTATVAVTINGTNDNIVAVADSITTTEETAVSATGNLLVNDTDVDVNETRSIVAVNGSVSAKSIATSGGYQITTLAGVVILILLDSDGSYTMTAPDALNDAQVYTATFQYTVQDGGSTQSTTTVTVNVTGNNDAPDAVAVTLTASDEDAVRIITQADLLAGASDPDSGAVLAITDLSLTSGNGVLAINGDGTWTYTPDLDDNSAVTFNYTVSDSTLTAMASAWLDLLPFNDWIADGDQS